MHVQPAPTSVSLWRATNPVVRDFRRDVFGAHFEATPLAPDATGAYVASVPPPAAGYTAFFVEATVRGTTYSTRAYVTPDN